MRFTLSRTRESAITARVAVLAAAAALILAATAAGAGPAAAARTSPARPTALVAPTRQPAGSGGSAGQVHALGNDNSATITWSGPATVDGAPTTSWTVTASTGQSVVAHQPNHWAIMDGLSNGIPVSFTVTASSAAGSTAPSARSNTVRPEPVAPPRHVLLGKPRQVSYDQHSLFIGGKRVFVYSGEFDPWRLPSPSLWTDRLQEMKAAGFNTVTVYFNWAYTSPAPGVYNFSGVRDMNLFLNDAQRVGLYVIARPGPYINAETSAGGFPGWLVTQSGVARTDAPDYVAAAKQWLSEIDPIIAAHQITRGGDVILYQVENEEFHTSASTIAYMAALNAKARADGIGVPLTGNSSAGFQGTAGAPAIPGYDIYPAGFNCADTGIMPNPYSLSYAIRPGVPLMLPEFQGGSFNAWGSLATYADCRKLTGTAFESIWYKSNIAQGVTIQGIYMAAGGTNWGWLPAPFVYTSYDYGAPITESGALTAKYRALKLIAEMTGAVAPLTDTNPATAPAPTNPGVTAVERVNPSTGTEFLYLRQANASSTATVTTQASFSAAGGTVPRHGAITLRGREAKLLVANWRFGHTDLVYSTSEVATQGTVAGGQALLLYGDAGTDGETVLHYPGQPQVTVLSGNVQSNWDAGTGDLRLDYVHQGLAEVRVRQAGHSLLLLIGTHTTAEQFWVQHTGAGTVLVRGADLVRTASVHAGPATGGLGAVVSLTGDTKASGPVRVWAPEPVQAVVWNGRRLSLTRHRDGSVSATLPGAPAISVPALTTWRFHTGAPERLPGYNDSAWPVADHATTTNPTKPASLPVLYADDYGFHQGFTWYRGRFTATAATTGITLVTGSPASLFPTGAPSPGAYSVWLNGVFLGSDTADGPQTKTFGFPASALRPGRPNVVAVLVEDFGHNEDGVYPAPSDNQKYPRGLLGASLTTAGGAAAPTVTWRLEGNKGGTSLQDPVRGVMNATGLYGTNHGYDLPGYPDGNWRTVRVPGTVAHLAAGVSWYRTTFSLNLPRGVWAPMGLRLSPVHGGRPGPGKGQWQALVFLNGWLVGRYVNYLGPQQTFYLPQGILRAAGSNTLAIAVWTMRPGQSGLGKVSLVPYTVREGGIRVAPVRSPGYSRAADGRPAAR